MSPDVEKSDQNVASPRYQVDNLEIDVDRQTVRQDGNLLDLPELSFKLLVALISHAPNEMSKDELIRKVWGDVVVSDETLAQRVRLLRQVLGDDGQNPRYITSVRGRGYRLKSQVSSQTNNRIGHTRIRTWSAAIAVLALGLITTWLVQTNRPDASVVDTVSLAVLPFLDLSANNDNQHFADGMQEELLTRLSQIAGLSVISRTSVEQYRSSELDLVEIAEALDAESVIEGSVRVDAERVRITVQLIDAHTDRHLWSENYDRALTVADIFSIQEEVAEQIAQVLERDYAGATESLVDQAPTANIAAYEAYLLGRYYTFRPTPENLELAVSHLGQATTLDSTFAEAYAALGWAYSFLGTTYGSRAPSDAFPEARKAALRAIALDSNLAGARRLHAAILTWYDWDFSAAESEYELARSLDPGATELLGHALLMSVLLRHEEAISLAEQSVNAEPNDPWRQVNAAWRYSDAGLTEKAIDAAKAAERHPDSNAALGSAYLRANRFEDAIQVFENDIEENGRNPLQLSNLATASFKAGRSDIGEQLVTELNALAAISYVSPTLLAAPYFASGDAEMGFSLLEDAVNVRAREAIFVQVNDMLREHRRDPRYAALVERIGFDRVQTAVN